MQTMADEWIEEGKQIGRQESREQQRTIILRILQRRFQQNEGSLQSIANQLMQITDDRLLLQLVDLALEVMILPDFRARLQRLIAESAT